MYSELDTFLTILENHNDLRTKGQQVALIFQVSKVGSPIRKSPDQSLFATPRGLSQRITSFIACACQGIHRTPLRHLIVLIANTHLELEWAWQKDQLLETYSKVAVRHTYHVQRLSGLTAANR